MADQRRSGSSKIEAHPLVEALVPDPSQPPERTTKLFGYPGKSPEAKATRLWLDLDLSSYVDVPDDAIRYSKTLPDDAGTILWVVADASLQYGSVSSHQTQADFLSGGITTAYLGGAGRHARLAFAEHQLDAAARRLLARRSRRRHRIARARSRRR